MFFLFSDKIFAQLESSKFLDIFFHFQIKNKTNQNRILRNIMELADASPLNSPSKFPSAGKKLKCRRRSKQKHAF